MKVEMNDTRRYVEAVSRNDKRIETHHENVKKEVSKTQEATEKENKSVKEIVDKLNKELEAVDTSIKFKVHESAGNGLNKISIAVVEKDSDKVIVEIPSEETIELAEKMEAITGLLFDHSR